MAPLCEVAKLASVWRERESNRNYSKRGSQSQSRKWPGTPPPARLACNAINQRVAQPIRIMQTCRAQNYELPWLTLQSNILQSMIVRNGRTPWRWLLRKGQDSEWADSTTVRNKIASLPGNCSMHNGTNYCVHNRLRDITQNDHCK